MEDPIHGVCTVLALVKRRRKVSFIEAWHILQTNGVRTYVVSCMSVSKRYKRTKQETTRHTFY
jgi:hypothetical protein